MNHKILIRILALSSAVLLSIPWLVPHAGAVALFALVPLLLADDLATRDGSGHFWLTYASAFVLWNAATTFWVCNATVGGGIFAVLCNSLQMSLIWSLFRFSKKRLRGALPYFLLASCWIAWEKLYFNVDISWPWLTLGGAFARSIQCVQWYEFTGTLGGSLWIWICNLGIFGFLSTDMNRIARRLSAVGLVLAVGGPLVASKLIYNSYEEKSESRIEVLLAQPNFDPYEKFESLSQREQNDILLGIFSEGIMQRNTAAPLLLVAPETFSDNIILNRFDMSLTAAQFREFLSCFPFARMLFGASTYEYFPTRSAPTTLAREDGDGWVVSHNSAIMLDAESDPEVFHKSKLVVGVETVPFPKIFLPLDKWLGSLMGYKGLMGRCEGQDSISLLHFDEDKPLGCAICYESVYGDYCRGYENAGAKAMTVITNDAWWGNTPGYVQHQSYSCLRAVELRRDVARCANTGISCFINQRGDVVSQTGWWQRTALFGVLNLNSEQTFFAMHGDMPGRACTFAFLLLLLLLVVRTVSDGLRSDR